MFHSNLKRTLKSYCSEFVIVSVNRQQANRSPVESDS